MSDERSAHIVVMHFPKAAYLGKLMRAVFLVAYGRTYDGTYDHIGVLEHSRHIVHHHKALSFNEICRTHHVLAFLDRVFVYEDALFGELGGVSDPDEVVCPFLEFVS